MRSGGRSGCTTASAIRRCGSGHRTFVAHPAQLRTFAADIARDHGLGAALAVHRVGRVEVGEPAVVVVAVSVHRGRAFTAASALIDRVKSEGWIWKRELRADGEVWVEGC